MADIVLDNQAPGATPAAGQTELFIDNTSKRFSQKNDAGVIEVMNGIRNASSAAQGPGFAADTYLTGSNVQIPVQLVRVGTVYRCRVHITKTGAGLATPIFIVRFGTNGNIADTARITFTFPVQTANIDDAWVEIWVVFRSIGAAGVAQGIISLIHTLAATGFSTANAPVIAVTSAGFDTTVANSFIGVSANGGASAAWTVQLVTAELLGV
jgi:hypothetical protein